MWRIVRDIAALDACRTAVDPSHIATAAAASATLIVFLIWARVAYLTAMARKWDAHPLLALALLLLALNSNTLACQLAQHGCTAPDDLPLLVILHAAPAITSGGWQSLGSGVLKRERENEKEKLLAISPAASAVHLHAS